MKCLFLSESFFIHQCDFAKINTSRSGSFFLKSLSAQQVKYRQYRKARIFNFIIRYSNLKFRPAVTEISMMTNNDLALIRKFAPSVVHLMSFIFDIDLQIFGSASCQRPRRNLNLILLL